MIERNNIRKNYEEFKSCIVDTINNYFESEKFANDDLIKDYKIGCLIRSMSIDEKQTDVLCMVDLTSRYPVKYFDLSTFFYQYSVKDISYMSIISEICGNYIKSCMSSKLDAYIKEKDEIFCKLCSQDEDMYGIEFLNLKITFHDKYGGIVTEDKCNKVFSSIDQMKHYVTKNIFEHHAVKYDKIVGADGRNSDYYVVSLSDYKYSAISLLNKNMLDDMADRLQSEEIYVGIINNNNLLIGNTNSGYAKFSQITKLSRDEQDNSKLPDSIYLYNSISKDLVYPRQQLHVVDKKKGKLVTIAKR